MKYADRHSHSSGKTLSLTRNTFDKLRDYILSRTGIYFQDNKLYLLQSRLTPRLVELELQSFEDYFLYLTSTGKTSEFTKMVSAITINETYFFRSPGHFDIIQKSIIPQVIQLKQSEINPKIRLWSTACSAGDEPYTLAIILHQHFLERYPDIQFEILATDIDPNILAKAQKGVYNAYSVRNIPAALLEKYFVKREEEFHIKQTLSKLITFKRINLSDRMEMMGVHNIDLAICANVLIYFPKQIRQRVVTSIYNSLSPDGFFLVGFSETLYGIEHKFQQARNGKSITYRKGS